MTESLDLPPPYHAIALREHRDAFTHAQAVATEEGAGALVWVRRFDLIEIAVVLEPDEALNGARRALYAVMNAAADALAAHCPPEKPLAFAWPDTILLDGGILGGVRLAAPAGASETATPDWLVAGLMLRAAIPHVKGRAKGDGAHPLDLNMTRGTSLEIEGFELLDQGPLIGSFARHLMVQVDLWQEKGFVPVGEQFLARMLEEKGIRHGIDGNGDLLERSLKTPTAAPARTSLLDALARPQWLDPETGDPWL